MKIKRFFAADIRQAMRMVKEELGSDAVIMSNKSVDGGVEIVAARDFDEQLIQSKLQKQAAEQQSSDRSYRSSADSDTSSSRETKKVDLPDFEAEKNHLHVLSSQRKQSAEGFVPERSPVRPQRFPLIATLPPSLAVGRTGSLPIPTLPPSLAVGRTGSLPVPTLPPSLAVAGILINMSAMQKKYICAEIWKRCRKSCQTGRVFRNTKTQASRKAYANSYAI